MAGWETQEEAALSPPASEAGRPGGSDSALSGNAPWGLAAAGSFGGEQTDEGNVISISCISDCIDIKSGWTSNMSCPFIFHCTVSGIYLH